jgi:hypothetical protein
MQTKILSTLGSIFFLLAALCVFLPGTASASPLALPKANLNGLLARTPFAAPSSETLDFSRLTKRKSSKISTSKSKSSKSKKISGGAIAGIIIAIIVIVIIIAVILFLKKRKSQGH